MGNFRTLARRVDAANDEMLGVPFGGVPLSKIFALGRQGRFMRVTRFKHYFMASLIKIPLLFSIHRFVTRYQDAYIVLVPSRSPI
jgi:hypothetical protein